MERMRGPFGASAIDDPMSYPGACLEHSFVVRGDRVEPAPDDDAALEELVAGRTAVLAYGSNAAPAQLLHKFGGDPSLVLPVLQASVSDVGRGFSRHLSRYGAVPATVYASRGARLDTFVLFADSAQLASIDRSERRNYERVTLDVRAHPVSCAVPCVDVHLYRSTRGVLGLDGTPAAFAAQERLWLTLIDRWRGGDADLPSDPAALVAFIGALAANHDRVQAALEAHTDALDDDLTLGR